MVKFLHYYDACSEGLLEANPDLRFGGPGTAQGASATFKLLLEHCAWGRNYFTGERGVRIDFVSTHRKNTPHEMIRDELAVWEYVGETFPDYCPEWPVMNNEADPIAGWGIPYYWRTGPWYAAFIVQSVELHNRLILDSIANTYSLLSNDHGFLGSWGKRTQLARFIPGDNDQIMRGASGTGGGREVSVEEDTRTQVQQFYLIKKPSLTVMSMMDLFGEQRFEVKGMDDARFPHAGAIVSQHKSGDFVLALFNKPELDLRTIKGIPTMLPTHAHKKLLSQQGVEISLELQGIPDGTYRWVHYRFDEIHGHAYKAWLEMGSPEDPDTEQYRKLAASMEPAMLESADIRVLGGTHRVQIKFPSSGVSFVLLLSRGEKPEKIQGLNAKLYKGLNGEDMVMLNWEKTPGPGLRTYEVFARSPKDTSFQKVNQADLLSTGFAHAVDAAAGYRYKVRAVDHWDRKGVFSEEIQVETQTTH
jgi:L-iduronidase